MNLSEFCIKRPVFATVLSLILVAVGIMGFAYLNTRFMPKYSRQKIRIITSYPGASAKLVESSITTPIEQSIGGIQGIKTIQSKSLQGQSVIKIELQQGMSKYEVANQIRNRIDMNTDDLPSTIKSPIVQAGWDESDLIDIGFLSKSENLPQLRDYLERYVIDQLEQIPGVANVGTDGVNQYAMRIWLNPDKMRALHVSVSDIESAVKNANIELPAGEIKTNSINYPITAKTRLVSAKQFSNIVIKKTSTGLVRIHDVAKVKLGKNNNPHMIVRINGKPGILLETFPTADANPIATAARIKQFIQQVRPQLPPGVSANIVYNQAHYMQASIREVYISIFIAIFCVGIVILFFLGHLRSMLVPVVTIPICLIATFGLMYLFGFTINVITLLAMVLAIGLVVDDAIVVLENIHRHIEQGIQPYKAALRGSREITFAVIAMTITLAAVYAPIGLVKSQAAIIFSSFAFTLAGAVVLSGFIALTLTPMMCSRLLKSGDKTRYSRWLDLRLTTLTDRYQTLLELALRYRLMVLGLGIIIAGCGVWLFMSLPKSNVPLEDMGFVLAHVHATAGTTADSKQKQIATVAKFMHEFNATQNVVSISDDQSDSYDIIFDTLKPYAERRTSAVELSYLLNKKIRGVAGLSARAFTPHFGSSSKNNALEFYIMDSGSYKNLYHTVHKLLQKLRKISGVTDVNTNLNFNSQQYNLTVNRNLAGQLGVSVATIDNTVADLIGGTTVSTFNMGGKNYDVIIQADNKLLHDLSVIKKFYINNGLQQLTPLSPLIHLQPVLTQQTLQHYNRLRAAEVGANVAAGYNFGALVHTLDHQLPKMLPNNVKFAFTGAAAEVFQTSNSMSILFILAIVFIYLVLSAQFESFIDPFIILLAVPLSIVGALVSLKLINGSINLYTSIGLVTLIGLIAKHGILITNFANKLQLDGIDRYSALIKSARIRLRPILMTTAAMIFGALPLLMASGAGAISRRQVGGVIVGGLLFGTFFSLILVPVAYSFLSKPATSRRNPEA